MEPMTAEECMQCLRGGQIASVALTRGSLPVVEPILYNVLDDALAVWTPFRGSLTHQVGNVVAVGAHQLWTDSPRGWEVNAIGRVGALPDDEYERLRALGFDNVAPEQQSLLRISIARITGSRLSHPG